MFIGSVEAIVSVGCVSVVMSNSCVDGFVSDSKFICRRSLNI